MEHPDKNVLTAIATLDRKETGIHSPESYFKVLDEIITYWKDIAYQVMEERDELLAEVIRLRNLNPICRKRYCGSYQCNCTGCTTIILN